jgi:hypothetical protein
MSLLGLVCLGFILSGLLLYLLKGTPVNGSLKVIPWLEAVTHVIGLMLIWILMVIDYFT